MPDTSIRKLGGTCAILVGICYILFGVTTLLDPSQTSAAAWQTRIQSPTLFLIGQWSLVLGALFALALVPAVAQWLEATNLGWVNWLSKIAYLGFFVTALASVQAVSIDVLYASIDPSSWLVIGCVGLWVLGVNLLGLRVDTWPKPLAYLGLAVALMYGLALVGNVLGIPILFTIAAGLGGVVLAPIWYIWLGRLLRH
jgi:hypothetical protein